MSGGRFTYARFSNLRHLAKTSVGISSKVYALTIPMIIENYYNLTKIIEQLDDQITIFYNKTDALIHKIPGIGIITAAFAGLDVSVSQPGLKEHRGRIIRRNSPLLRKRLYIYSLQSLKYIPQFWIVNTKLEYFY